MKTNLLGRRGFSAGLRQVSVWIINTVCLKVKENKNIAKIENSFFLLEPLLIVSLFNSLFISHPSSFIFFNLYSELDSNKNLGRSWISIPFVLVENTRYILGWRARDSVIQIASVDPASHSCPPVLPVLPVLLSSLSSLSSCPRPGSGSLSDSNDI